MDSEGTDAVLWECWERCIAEIADACDAGISADEGDGQAVLPLEEWRYEEGRQDVGESRGDIDMDEESDDISDDELQDLVSEAVQRARRRQAASRARGPRAFLAGSGNPFACPGVEAEGLRILAEVSAGRGSMKRFWEWADDILVRAGKRPDGKALDLPFLASQEAIRLRDAIDEARAN